MQLSGHRNVQSVNNYSTVSNEQQKIPYARAFHEVISILFPYFYCCCCCCFFPEKGEAGAGGGGGGGRVSETEERIEKYV